MEAFGFSNNWTKSTEQGRKGCEWGEGQNLGMHFFEWGLPLRLGNLVVLPRPNPPFEHASGASLSLVTKRPAEKTVATEARWHKTEFSLCTDTLTDHDTKPHRGGGMRCRGGGPIVYSPRLLSILDTLHLERTRPRLTPHSSPKAKGGGAAPPLRSARASGGSGGPRQSGLLFFFLNDPGGKWASGGQKRCWLGQPGLGSTLPLGGVPVYHRMSHKIRNKRSEYLRFD